MKLLIMRKDVQYIEGECEQGLCRRSREKILLGRLGLSLKDNSKTDLREMGCDVSSSVQGPVMDSCEHGNKISGSMKGWEFLVNQDTKWKYFSPCVTWFICVTVRESAEYIKKQVFVRGGEFFFLAGRNVGMFP
jgi:hypothetical protein